MSVIDEWVNPLYLDDDYVETIRESIIAKPHVKYAVLDNFFREDKLDQLIEHHQHLQFSEEQDRRCHIDGSWLPYDGAVVFANDENFGSELFFDEEWHQYCCFISGARISSPIGTEVKLRYHRPDADGFWIHTDSTIRDVVIICYFNRGWAAGDGGLLQLWRVDEELSRKALKVEKPSGRLDFLECERIQTKSPGGGFPDGNVHDLVLLDQIVPAYNRVFICNFKDAPAYHSVTPSNGKSRQGFVQWLFDRRKHG